MAIFGTFHADRRNSLDTWSWTLSFKDVKGQTQDNNILEFGRAATSYGLCTTGHRTMHCHGWVRELLVNLALKTRFKNFHFNVPDSKVLLVVLQL